MTMQPAPKFPAGKYAQMFIDATTDVRIKKNTIKDTARTIDRLWDRNKLCERLVNYLEYIRKHPEQYEYLNESVRYEYLRDDLIRSIPDLIVMRKIYCDNIELLLKHVEELKRKKLERRNNYI